MAKKGNCNDRRGGSNQENLGKRRLTKLMVRVLPEDGSGFYRCIDPAHVRYYFTRSAWLQGVITRKWITALFQPSSGGELDWRDVPILGDGIYVRTEEGAFRLADIRSLSKVVDQVGGDLLRTHESVLVNRDWVHDYSPVRAEIGVLVNGRDGKSHIERVQVSTRYKKAVVRALFERQPKRPRPLSTRDTPTSLGTC